MTVARAGEWWGLVIALLTASCSADQRRPTAGVPSSTVQDASTAETDAGNMIASCAAHGTDRAACTADRACMSMFQGGPHGRGGPMVCIACRQWANLEGVPSEFCDLRARGNDRAACELRAQRSHGDPERCGRLSPDAGAASP